MDLRSVTAREEIGVQAKYVNATLHAQGEPLRGRTAHSCASAGSQGCTDADVSSAHFYAGLPPSGRIACEQPLNTLARCQLTTTCEMYRLETVLRRQGFASQRERAADSYASLRRDRSSDTWPWITRVLAGIVRRRGSVDLSTTASMSLKQCTDVPHPPISRRGRGRNEALSPYQNAIRTSPAWRSGTAAAAGVP